MVDKKKKNDNSNMDIQRTTFSKKWLSRILTFSLAWITLSYILAFMGRDQIAQELSQQVVAVIISTVITYFLKSFFETREEEKNKLERDKMDHSIEYDNTTNFNEVSSDEDQE